MSPSTRTPYIDRLREIVSYSRQMDWSFRLDHAVWLMEHSPELMAEIEGLLMAEYPLEHYLQVIKTLHIHMDELVRKANPMSQEVIAVLKDRVAALEAENAKLQYAARANRTEVS